MEETKEMRDIHKIMENSYEKRKELSDLEVIQSIHNSSNQLLQKYGLILRKPGQKKP